MSYWPLLGKDIGLGSDNEATDPVWIVSLGYRLLDQRKYLITVCEMVK